MRILFLFVIGVKGNRRRAACSSKSRDNRDYSWAVCWSGGLQPASRAAAFPGGLACCEETPNGCRERPSHRGWEDRRRNLPPSGTNHMSDTVLGARPTSEASTRPRE